MKITESYLRAVIKQELQKEGVFDSVKDVVTAPSKAIGRAVKNLGGKTSSANLEQKLIEIVKEFDESPDIMDPSSKSYKARGHVEQAIAILRGQ